MYWFWHVYLNFGLNLAKFKLEHLSQWLNTITSKVSNVLIMNKSRVLNLDD